MTSSELIVVLLVGYITGTWAHLTIPYRAPILTKAWGLVWRFAIVYGVFVVIPMFIEKIIT